MAEDLDTDGHVDLVCAFTRPGEVLLQAAPPGSPDHEPMEDNRERLEAAGLTVRRLDVLPEVEVEGLRIAVSHMNFYLCNGAVVVPVAGVESDEPALASATLGPTVRNAAMRTPRPSAAMAAVASAFDHWPSCTARVSPITPVLRSVAKAAKAMMNHGR